MSVCESLNAYASNVDWACWAIMFVLGVWKMTELLVMAGKWAERKIK